MVQILEADNSWADAARKFGGDLVQGYANRSDEQAIQKSIMALGDKPTARQILDALTNTKTHSPQAKQQALKNFMGVAEFEEAQAKNAQAQKIAQEQNKIAEERNRINEELGKESNTISRMGKQSEGDRVKSIDNFISQGFEQEEAEALTNPYVPNSVKQGISKRVEEELARGIRQKPTQVPAASLEQAQPIEPNHRPEGLYTGANADVPVEPIPELKDASTVNVGESEKKNKEEMKQIEREVPGKDLWPDLPPPPNTTAAEKEKWRASNQKDNNKALKEAKVKTVAHTNSLIRYGRLTALNNSGKLPEGMGRLVLNPQTGEPYGVASLLGVVNKETQDFVKTMNDFLIDAKSYFGSRVTNFDVQAFKSRLPTLLNTEDGRRLIVEQMKLMEELQIVHDKGLEDGLKHYSRNASYSDIQRVVDDKTILQEKAIINKIDNLDQATNYMDVMAKNPKYKDTKLFQNPDTGKFKAFRPGEIKNARAKGWIEW